MYQPINAATVKLGKIQQFVEVTVLEVAKNIMYAHLVFDECNDIRNFYMASVWGSGYGVM